MRRRGAQGAGGSDGAGTSAKALKSPLRALFVDGHHWWFRRDLLDLLEGSAAIVFDIQVDMLKVAKVWAPQWAHKRT